MTFYFVEPKNPGSLSRRWIVDDVGLEKVKDHYQNYKKDPTNPYNRWGNFGYKVINEINLDFGGMMFMDTPDITEKIDGTTINIPVTHLSIFLNVALSFNMYDKKRDFWCFRMWHFVVGISKETRNKLYKKFKSKEHLYQEMAEGLKKHIDKTADECKILRMERK